MLEICLDISLVMLSLSLAMMALRSVLGPHSVDRLVAIDTMLTNIAALFAVLLIRFGTWIFFDAVLMVALLGFVGTVALARFLYRGHVFD